MIRSLVLAPACLAALLAASLQSPAAEPADKIRRGEYLATIGLCNDCHTPLKTTPDGPVPDMSRMLSGHPAAAGATPPIRLPEPWMAAIGPSLTAFSGPWGVSYAANLTPDPETGVLRGFTEAQFVATLRNGRHQGQGREILPPMPWPWIGKMTDEDLGALFAYLRQIPPVRNRVPDPLPPVN
ncbi:c-type cytochrome [Prosthecomicrobium sp. N25]|uniref:c-type cytochrome n=1 Tax=Prosthecomicrobium sp. N25 TaxID=3129254 RepID=UPI003077E599